MKPLSTKSTGLSTDFPVICRLSPPATHIIHREDPFSIQFFVHMPKPYLSVIHKITHIIHSFFIHNSDLTYILTIQKTTKSISFIWMGMNKDVLSQYDDLPFPRPIVPDSPTRSYHLEPAHGLKRQKPAPLPYPLPHSLSLNPDSH
jgi:hypothetical protein